MEENVMVEEEKAESVFHNKDYVLLFVGYLVSNLGNQLYNFAISYYIYTIASASIAGLYLATGGVVYFIFAAFGGAIVDRLDRVKVVFITDYIRGITILVAGYLMISGLNNQQQLIMLFICTTILSINGALFQPASSALPANILKKNQLQQSNSLFTMSNALYGIIGALAGVAIYELLGIKMVFIVNGVSFIVSGISEMFIRVKTKENPDHVVTVKGVLEDIKIGFQYLVSLKPVLYLILCASLLNFFTTPAIVNGLPYLFSQKLQTSSLYYGYLMAAFPAGIIISSIVLGMKKQEKHIFPLMRNGLIGMAAMFSIFVLVLNSYLLQFSTFTLFIILSITAVFVMGIYNGFINIPFATAIQTNVEKEKLGRVFSALNIIAMGLTPIAIGLAGFAIDALGILLFFYVAAIGLILTTVLTISNKYVRQL